MEKRKRRSKKSQQQTSLPKSLEQVNLNAAGIDMGAESHWVAVPVDRDQQPVSSAHSRRIWKPWPTGWSPAASRR